MVGMSWSGAWRAGWGAPGCGRAHPPQPGAGRAAGGAGTRVRRSSTPPPAARAARCWSPARRASASRGSSTSCARGRPTAGMTVLVGRSVDGGGTYRAVTEALARLVRRDAALDDPALRPYRAALRRLLPGMRRTSRSTPRAPDPTVMLGEGVARAAGRARTLLVLEDLHWADPDTLDLVRYLAGALVDVPRAAGGDGPRRRRRGPGLARLATDVRTLAVASPGRRGRGRAGGGLPRGPLSAAERRGAGRPRRRAAAAGRGAARRRADAGAAVVRGAGGGTGWPPCRRRPAGGARGRGGRRHRLAVAAGRLRSPTAAPRRCVTGRRPTGRGRRCAVAASAGRRRGRAARRRRRSAALPPRPDPRRRARHPAAAGARGARRTGRPRARRRRRPRGRGPALPRGGRPGPRGRRSSSSWPARTSAAAPSAAPPPSSTRRASTPRAAERVQC